MIRTAKTPPDVMREIADLLLRGDKLAATRGLTLLLVQIFTQQLQA